MASGKDLSVSALVSQMICRFQKGCGVWTEWAVVTNRRPSTSRFRSSFSFVERDDRTGIKEEVKRVDALVKAKRDHPLAARRSIVLVQMAAHWQMTGTDTMVPSSL